MIFEDEEEEIELVDGSTSTHDLISFSSKEIQTVPIPEPPPVYRPKTEEIQVQTDTETEEADEPEVKETGISKQELENLFRRIEPTVLKDALDEHHRQGGLIQETGSEVLHGQELPADLTHLPPQPRSTSAGFRYFDRFRFGSSGASFSNSIINIITPNPSEKPEFNLMNASVRMYSSVLFLLATGCVLGRFVFPGSIPITVHHLVKGMDGGGGVNMWVTYNTLGGGREGHMLSPQIGLWHTTFEAVLK